MTQPAQTPPEPLSGHGGGESAGHQGQEDIPEAHGVLPQSEGCGSCGALLDHDDRFCGFCGARHEVAEVPAGQLQTRHFQCQNCGASVTADPNQRSQTCAFCDAPHVAEFSPDLTGRQPPEFVVGFAVTRDEARKRFHGWVADRGFFHPRDLESAKLEGKLQGVYVPFWSFSMFAESDWSATIGEHYYRTERTSKGTRQVRETEWHPLSGRHHRFYSHYLISGSRGLTQEEADSVKPFHLAALHRYAPAFLAGWQSEEYTVERDEAMQRSKQEFHRREHVHIAEFLPGDTYRHLTVQTNFSRVSSDLILLPIYLANYRYGGKKYRFLINGQTGKVAGQKPYSVGRIALAVIAGLLLVGALAFLALR